MQCEVRLFAGVAEAAGRDRVIVELPGCNGTASGHALISALAEQYPELTPLLPRCRLAVAGRFAEPDAIIEASSEVALIPPVSGG
jgi:molybdopterin synthase catalytic subunit